MSPQDPFQPSRPEKASPYSSPSQGPASDLPPEDPYAIYGEPGARPEDVIPDASVYGEDGATAGGAGAQSHEDAPLPDHQGTDDQEVLDGPHETPDRGTDTPYAESGEAAEAGPVKQSSSQAGGQASSPSQSSGQGASRGLHPSVTPFYDRMAGWALSWEIWNGFRVPTRCGDPEVEATTLRLGCGIADLTPQCIIRIDGETAAQAVDRMTTLNAPALADGMVQATLLCDGKGRVVAVADVARLGADSFLLISETMILPWVEDACRGMAVKVLMEPGSIAVLGLFGPRIFETLIRCGLMRESQAVPGGMVSIARHGLLGQLFIPDGPGGPFGVPSRAEIWLEPGDAGTLWDWILRDCGQTVRPIGLASLETARIMAGWPRLGRDAPSPDEAIDRQDCLDAFDLGLDMLIDWDKPAFSGRKALLVHHEHMDEMGERLFHIPLPGPSQPGQHVRRGDATARLTSVARCPVTGSWWGLARSKDPVPAKAGNWVLETLDNPLVRLTRPGAILRS